MNVEFILYILGAMCVGFVLGMIVELFADQEQINRLKRKNECLKLEIQALIDGKTEVIEIVDKRESEPNEVKFGGF